VITRARPDWRTFWLPVRPRLPSDGALSLSGFPPGELLLNLNQIGQKVCSAWTVIKVISEVFEKAGIWRAGANLGNSWRSRPVSVKIVMKVVDTRQGRG